MVTNHTLWKYNHFQSYRAKNHRPSTPESSIKRNTNLRPATTIGGGSHKDKVKTIATIA